MPLRLRHAINILTLTLLHYAITLLIGAIILFIDIIDYTLLAFIAINTLHINIFHYANITPHYIE